MRRPRRLSWLGLVTGLLLLSGAACSSAGGGSADASAGAAGSNSAAGAGGGTAHGGAGGSAGGQASSGAAGAVAGGGQSGSHGAAGTTGAAGAPATGDCNVAYDCPAGQTCFGPGGQNFSCVTSGPGKAGDACTPSTTSPPCGDQLLCAGSSTSATCVQICDATHPCPSNKTCTTVATQADQFLNICE